MAKTPNPRPESPTRKAVRAMHRDGMNPREIATALGISTSAIYQHLKAIREQDQRTDAA